jgi:hypothetical protein
MHLTDRLDRWSRAAALLGTGLLLAAPDASAAGNVRVGSVTPGGDLRVNGDASGNDIAITQNAPGDIVITGRNGTTVNGQPSVTRSGVTGELKVNPRGGDDTVEIDGVQVEDLEVEDQIGRNDIDVKNTRVDDEIEIEKP